MSDINIFLPEVNPEKVTIAKLGTLIRAGTVALYLLHAYVATYLSG